MESVGGLHCIMSVLFVFRSESCARKFATFSKRIRSWYRKPNRYYTTNAKRYARNLLLANVRLRALSQELLSSMSRLSYPTVIQCWANTGCRSRVDIENSAPSNGPSLSRSWNPIYGMCNVRDLAGSFHIWTFAEVEWYDTQRKKAIELTKLAIVLVQRTISLSTEQITQRIKDHSTEKKSSNDLFYFIVSK